MNLRKVTIYLLTSCNTEERIAQNIYIHNSNRNFKKLTTTTIILIKKRIGIGRTRVLLNPKAHQLGWLLNDVIIQL